jgi:hypothetical protein
MGVISQNTYVHGASGVGGIKKWLAALSSLTLEQRVAAISTANATLEIYDTVILAASLEIPSNITVVMKPGSSITLGAGITLGINGHCICEGSSHFILDADAWLIFGHLTAPARQMFSGAGLPHVRFGLGAEIITDPHCAASAGWTYTGWTFNNPGFTHNTGNTSILVTPSSLTSINKFYWSIVRVSAGANGTFRSNVGGMAPYPSRGNVGYWENSHIAGSAAAPNLSSVTTDCDAKILYFSAREILGTGNAELPVQWWGAKSDGTDCSPAINAALQAAKGGLGDSSQSQGHGKKVTIATGRFICASPIYHPSGAVLHGSPGPATVLEISSAYSTGTVPTYAALKYDASVAEYDTGFYFLDNYGNAGWTSNDVLGGIVIDARYSNAGDLVAGAWTKDFSLLYFLRNNSYFKCSNIQLFVHESYYQSHLFVGSENVTSKWSGDSYSRSGLMVDGLFCYNTAQALHRWSVYYPSSGDGQLSTWENVNIWSDNVIAIMDSENCLKNCYVHPRSDYARYSVEAEIDSIAGDSMSVTVSGYYADSYKIGETIQFKCPTNQWGSIAISGTSGSVQYGGGITTIKFTTPISASATHLYSPDGGQPTVIFGGNGNLCERLYVDALEDHYTPVMLFHNRNETPRATLIAAFITSHNCLVETNYMQVHADPGTYYEATAEISGRPDQIKIDGNHASEYVQNAYIYVRHVTSAGVISWRKGKLAAAGSYSNPYTTITTAEPIFQTLASGTQTIFRESVGPFYSLSKYGLTSHS